MLIRNEGKIIYTLSSVVVWARNLVSLPFCRMPLLLPLMVCTWERDFKQNTQKFDATCLSNNYSERANSPLFCRESEISKALSCPCVTFLMRLHSVPDIWSTSRPAEIDHVAEMTIFSKFHTRENVFQRSNNRNKAKKTI